jgi:hypothetical protein
MMVTMVTIVPIVSDNGDYSENSDYVMVTRLGTALNVPG